MNTQTFIGDDDRFARQYAYDDAVVIAVDTEMTDADVDVIDDTVVVVDPHDEQFELDVETTPTRAFMKNGVLTIEMEASA